MNKKELFLRHLDISRNNIIELLQDFLNSTDFEKITE